MGADGWFWFWVRVHGLGVSCGGPEAVWWADLLVRLSDDCLRLWLVWVCGQCVQGGGVTEQLKPGREEGLLRPEQTQVSLILKVSLLFCFHFKLN